MSNISNEDTDEHCQQSDPAAFYFGNEIPPLNAEFGGASDRGLVRPNNEDHFVVVRRYRSREVLLTNMPEDSYPDQEDDVYALAVADGVGGAAFGELASELALRTGWELTGRAFKWGFSLSEVEAKDLLKSVNIYVQLIHQRIKAEATNAHKGMGTTLTGVLTVGWDAFVIHVGDSRAYLHRDGKLHRLTHDQTLAELMVRSGMISSVSEAAQRFRNTLVSCLGGNYEDVEVESSHLTLQPGDEVLLCTDGLTDMVDEPKILQVLEQSLDPQAICNALIQAALEQGGRDNVTVVLGRYSQRDSSAATFDSQSGGTVETP